jgi:hypothetical protein
MEVFLALLTHLNANASIGIGEFQNELEVSLW